MAGYKLYPQLAQFGDLLHCLTSLHKVIVMDV